MVERQIDRDKVHVAIRRMGHESVLSLLDEAIDMLSEAELVRLVKGYLDPAKLRPGRKGKGGLLAEVKAFEKASLAGEYYESFNVNSKNCMQKSGGTRAWIAACERLLHRCVAAVGENDPAEVCQAFDILLTLLDHIDEGCDDIIFFADEGGSWQVGVDWAKVLPAWFTCLSATAEPEEYARRVVEVVDKHEKYRHDEHLAKARRTATPAQRKALREIS